MSYRRHRKRVQIEKVVEDKPKPELLQIPPPEVDRIWPLVEHLIVEGAWHGDCDPVDLHAKCNTNHCQLWVIFSDQVEAAGVTRLIETNKGRMLEFPAFAGTGMEGWWNTQDEVYAWAKDNGCIGVRVAGRRGWEKALKEKGFEPKYIVCEKELP